MSRYEEVEQRIGRFLRYGVMVAGFVILSGWLLQFDWYAETFRNFQIYEKISFINILQGHYHRQEWGALTTYLGLILLISLPLIRVLLTAYLFIIQKEFVLAGIAGFVFCTLILSMLMGL